MAEMDVALKDAAQIDGAIGAALVDRSSGMALGTGGGNNDFSLTVAANTDVINAKLRAIEMLAIPGPMQDVLVTLETQYHLIRPITGRCGQELFLYLALDKDRANLALARDQLRAIEQNLDI